MNNVDEKGFPGTEGDDGQFDGGDTCAILGTLIALNFQERLLPMSLRLMRKLLIRGDGMVRHPDASKWYGQTDRFSRDQLIPLLCSFVGDPVDKDVRIVFRWHQVHFFLYAWNWKKNGVMDAPNKQPDLTGPEIWALWARVMDGPWWLKMLLPVLDLETLIGSIIWRWFTPVTNRVSRNHMLVCLTGMKKYPTLTMRLANWINNWPDLIGRWRAHCDAVKEFQTADLFEQAIK